MNIVDFSEGILGLDHPLSDGRQARDVVAKCLRKLSNGDSVMESAANVLDKGERLNIGVVRSIGEDRLFQVKQLFYVS